MTSPKTLYILRHAKAETGSATQDDHTRRLMPRGIDAAHVIGSYAVRNGIKPDAVLCSTAARAQETWQFVQMEFGAEIPTQFFDKLYLASANEMLNVIAQVPDNVSSLLLVAHNPGLHQLCVQLAKKGDAQLLDTLMIKFPTCSLAGIALDITAWSQAPRAQGTLKTFVTPSMLSHGDDDN
jgi:phosphohistidine phosphatase